MLLWKSAALLGEDIYFVVYSFWVDGRDEGIAVLTIRSDLLYSRRGRKTYCQQMQCQQRLLLTIMANLWFSR